MRGNALPKRGNPKRHGGAFQQLFYFLGAADAAP
jgi:hypothetical protein